MFKLYSKGCQYALRTLAYVVTAQGSDRFLMREVCKKTGIPEAYTRKVFQNLVQAGFMEAHRGPGGGYSLKRDPSEISVLDVIIAVDGKDAYDGCVMGFDQCNPLNPCPVHHLWAEAKISMLDQLARDSLTDIAELTRSRYTGESAESEDA